MLEDTGVPFEVLPCAAEHAETADFCRHYGYPLEDSVNTLVVKAKTGDERFVACVLLATTRLDVNRVVRKRLRTRRLSFASPEETRRVTGMELGGVTPLGLPPELALWVDERVMRREQVILGGGNRRSKVVVSPEIFRHTPNTTLVPELAREPAADSG